MKYSTCRIDGGAAGRLPFPVHGIQQRLGALEVADTGEVAGQSNAHAGHGARFRARRLRVGTQRLVAFLDGGFRIAQVRQRLLHRAVQCRADRGVPPSPNAASILGAASRAASSRLTSDRPRTAGLDAPMSSSTMKRLTASATRTCSASCRADARDVR